MAKPNPFMAKAEKTTKPNPFIAKAQQKPKGKTKDEMAELRARKEELKIKAEKDRIKAIPFEVKVLAKRVKEAEREYVAACNEATKLFKKLDKAKPGTERAAELRHEWDLAERRSAARMASLQHLIVQHKNKITEAAQAA